jgi:hypothetical protein
MAIVEEVCFRRSQEDDVFNEKKSVLPGRNCVES